MFFPIEQALKPEVKFHAVDVIHSCSSEEFVHIVVQGT